MKVLKQSDYTTFERMCRLTQAGLKRTMSSYLRSKYNKVIETKDYIVAEGTIPIALVAHLDIAFENPPTEIYYDRYKNVMWGNAGAGFDDRAGVFAIYQLIRSGLRPHIIFTTDEEIGAKGASALGKEPMPFADMRYMIELDRRGTCDCVFYDCENPEFTKYIESFGFVEAIGSFSDISILAEAWGIAAVNCSIGYEHEHTAQEILYVGGILSTIERVRKMLTVADMPEQFKFIPSPWAGYGWYWKTGWMGADSTDEPATPFCFHCGKTFAAEELIPVFTEQDTVHNYCIDCIVDNVGWCSRCGEAYELGVNKEKAGLCGECRRIFHY